MERRADDVEDVRTVSEHDEFRRDRRLVGATRVAPETRFAVRIGHDEVTVEGRPVARFERGTRFENAPGGGRPDHARSETQHQHQCRERSESS
jgi:hypothetical protein